ncbi:hypothetical protein ACN4EK_12300 [Pantanalinema rosaneae CENA516]
MGIKGTGVDFWLVLNLRSLEFINNPIAVKFQPTPKLSHAEDNSTATF